MSSTSANRAGEVGESLAFGRLVVRRAWSGRLNRSRLVACCSVRSVIQASVAFRTLKASRRVRVASASAPASLRVPGAPPRLPPCSHGSPARCSVAAFQTLADCTSTRPNPSTRAPSRPRFTPRLHQLGNSTSRHGSQLRSADLDGRDCLRALRPARPQDVPKLPRAVLARLLLGSVSSSSLLASVQQHPLNAIDHAGTIFHRIIADFMIQGGDPTVRCGPCLLGPLDCPDLLFAAQGTGRGGVSIYGDKFEDEIVRLIVHLRAAKHADEQVARAAPRPAAHRRRHPVGVWSLQPASDLSSSRADPPIFADGQLWPQYVCLDVPTLACVSR